MSHDFTPGDTVRWRDGHSRHAPHVYGVVKRVGDKSITVTSEAGDQHVIRRQRYGAPWKTLEHIAPEEIAVIRWRARIPKTVCHAYWNERGRREDYHLEFSTGHRLKTPADVDHAIADLQALRAWLAERPGTEGV